MAKKTKTPDTPSGVLITSETGDVIRYDETGLVMRLGDQVIDDIALRLPQTDTPEISPQPDTSAAPYIDPHDYIPGIEAWNMRLVEDWILFTADLPGQQGVRGYRRPATGGDIIADASGPVQGILGIGGPRSAQALPRRADFPQHIVTPADDIGAVGHSGIETAEPRTTFAQLSGVTQGALIAENILHQRKANHQVMPLFVARCETESAASAWDLATGVAQKNLIIAAQNLIDAAALMGKTAEITAITLEYSFEDQSLSAAAYRDGMLDLMKLITTTLYPLGFSALKFIAPFDAGSPNLIATPAGQAVLQGQWELGWNHGDHRFVQSAPSYMFAHDTYDRPTDAAQLDMADMTTSALNDDAWHCPTFLLAERNPSNPRQIKVVTKAMENLLIDGHKTVPAGFFLQGTDVGISGVIRDPKDPKSLIIMCDAPLPDGDIQLGYGVGAKTPRAVRDMWAMTGRSGAKLHRWALPCLLPVCLGGGS